VVEENHKDWRGHGHLQNYQADDHNINGFQSSVLCIHWVTGYDILAMSNASHTANALTIAPVPASK
jgi:hypothetical protein